MANASHSWCDQLLICDFASWKNVVWLKSWLDASDSSIQHTIVLQHNISVTQHTCIPLYNLPWVFVGSIIALLNCCSTRNVLGIRYYVILCETGNPMCPGLCNQSYQNIQESSLSGLSVLRSPMGGRFKATNIIQIIKRRNEERPCKYHGESTVQND